MRALLSLLVLLVPLTVSAFELRTDSQGDVVKWRREVIFIVDPALGQILGDATALEAVKSAIAEIDAATPELKVTVKEGPVRGPGYELDRDATNQNEILALTDWPYTDSALASTVVTLNARTDEILDTDIVFNAEQHVFRVLTAPMAAARTFDDVQNTLTHELGHALGLMHNPMDERVVMYPRASAGEVGKRVLQEDDRDGLAALYGTSLVTPEAPPPQMGCSSTGGVGGWALGLFVLGGLALRRRPAPVLVRVTRGARGALVVLGVLMAASAAAQPVTPVGVGVVRAKVSHRSPSAPGLIVTSLDVEFESCTTASCERATRVTVPGGRLGELEQIVEHHPVPALNEHLGLAKKNGRWVVFRLIEHRHAERFNALGPPGLVRSAAPQTPAPAPGPVAQPVVPAK
ncbi:MAG: matrixin family metalloprotease [Myxococcales bacterium]|nr:matrixin family metalloprotease [Myxococcales bacterium]